ncbi:MAG: hypothetical protein Q8Q89_04525 [bacterium]|nr:hypothetical protein [bacterium]
MRKFSLGFLPVLIFCAIYSSACDPPPDANRNEYREESRFPQDFKTTGAYLVLEWNGRKPWVMASGNLVDREKGIFRTAKHFTDEFGKLGLDYCKVFFNGKVYRANLVRVPPLRDAALIKIFSSFSPDDFPKLLPVAKEIPKFGDKIYIQGFHPHLYKIRKINEEEGFSDKMVPIFETYYGVVDKDLNRETQVVFDDLEGRVIRPDPESVFKNKFLTAEQKKDLLEVENDKYTKVLMKRDHKFSFGGLSGGVALNDRGEIVGVITAQNPLKFEYDKHGFFFIPGEGQVEITEIKKQLWDTIYITPINSIKDLNEYIKNSK